LEHERREIQMSFLVSWEIDEKQLPAQQYLKTRVLAQLVRQEIEKLDVAAVPCASRDPDTRATLCKRAFLVTMMHSYETLVKLVLPQGAKLDSENSSDSEDLVVQEKFSREILKLWSAVSGIFSEALSVPSAAFDRYFEASNCLVHLYPAACVCAPMEVAFLGGIWVYSASILLCVVGSGAPGIGVGCALGFVTAASVVGLGVASCCLHGVQARGEFASCCDHLDVLCMELQGQDISAEDVAEIRNAFMASFKPYAT